MLTGVAVARLNIDVKDGIYAELKCKAHDEGRSVTDVVRVLVNDWLTGKREEEHFRVAVDAEEKRLLRARRKI